MKTLTRNVGCKLKVFAFLLYQWNRPSDYILATMRSAGTHRLWFMIAKAIVDYFNLNYEFKSIHPVEIVPGFSLDASSQFLYNRRHEIPRVQHTRFLHKFPWSVLFRGKKIILLIRDLRDACVSHYRKGLREDLRKNPALELKKVLRFLGLMSVDDECVRRVVDFCFIENMGRIGRRALEAGTGRGSQEITAVNKGVVGQFKDLWIPEVDAYFWDYIARHLRYYFGYSYD